MAVAQREGKWNGRPWLAGLLRVSIVLVPVLVGSLVAWQIAGHVGQWSNRWVQGGAVLAAAVVASMVTSRLTNRLMPLAMLLRMTMIFPDQAPSRMKVARRTTGMTEIKARLDSARLDERDAATTMLALVTALGSHDRRTRGHSERVRLFCDLLSEQLRLSSADAGRLRWAALIHDIGKLQVPAAVLNKPGKLNAREWDLIRLHPDAGALLAAPLKDWLGPWFAGIAEHHEKYDGTGYPRGLAASAITPAGRAIAVVDAFETMTASRSYQAARSTLAARAELTNCAGSHFDPGMVRAFLAISLPRLLWSVGPLAFAVNLPYIGWLGQGGLRLGTAVGTSASAANVAGVTAVAMAVGVTPTASASATPTVPAHRATTPAWSADRGASVAPKPTTHARTRPSTASPRTSAKPTKPATPRAAKAPKPGKTAKAPKTKKVPTAQGARDKPVKATNGALAKMAGTKLSGKGSNDRDHQH